MAGSRCSMARLAICAFCGENKGLDETMKHLHVVLRQGAKCRSKIVGRIFKLERAQRQSPRFRFALGRAELVGGLRVPQHAEPIAVGKCLLQQLNLLRRKLRPAEDDAGDVTAWTREALHISFRDRIEIGGSHDDRNRWTRRGRRLQRKLGTEREQHVCLPCDQLVGCSEGPRHALLLPGEIRRGDSGPPRNRACAGRLKRMGTRPAWPDGRAMGQSRRRVRQAPPVARAPRAARPPPRRRAA